MKQLFRTAFALSLCAAALTLFTGCAGYQMGPVKPAIYANIHKLYVPTFENETLEPRAAVLVTNAVIKQLQLDGTYEVTNKNSADAELRAKITRIERQQLRAARTDTLRTTELQLYLVIEYALYDPQTGQKLQYAQERDLDETNLDDSSGLRVRPGRIVGETIVFLDPNFQLSEREAIPLAAQDAAEKLVSRIAEGW